MHFPRRERLRETFTSPVVLAVLVWCPVVIFGAGQGWGVAAGAVPLVCLSLTGGGLR